jgi:long-chain acyl-CoA synthetase
MRPVRLLHETLLSHAARPEGRHNVAVIVDGKSHSYGELLDASRGLAGVLLERGVERGDRVAVYLDNSWTCVVSIYATLIAGAVLVLVHPQTRASKLEFILRDSGARALVTDRRLERTFRPALSRLEVPPEVIDEGLDAILSRARPLQEQVAAIALDLAAIIYTSGSTGHPKGVMQTHQSMVFTLGSLIEYLRLSSDERILCALPLSFDYGLYQLLMAVALGGTLVLERSFTFPADVLNRVRDVDVTVVPGVPTIFATILAIHGRSPVSFPSVRRVTNTAAALPEAFVHGLREVFPSALLYKMYGLTECKRVSYLEPELVDTKPGSVGQAIPGTEVYLLSQDGGPVPAGEAGLLYVRGPHVMAGYWNRPDLTERMLRPGKLPGERVLCTQDLFRMDRDGFLYFVGRTDDIIKTRGQKVSPVEVENALHHIAGVREAAVVGVPDPLMGEAIRAYVVADPEAGLTEKLIQTHSAARLEGYMVPAQVILCAELPRTPSGKVSKQLLLERMPQGVQPG